MGNAGSTALDVLDWVPIAGTVSRETEALIEAAQGNQENAAIAAEKGAENLLFDVGSFFTFGAGRFVIKASKNIAKAVTNALEMAGKTVTEEEIKAIEFGAQQRILTKVGGKTAKTEQFNFYNFKQQRLNALEISEMKADMVAMRVAEAEKDILSSLEKDAMGAEQKILGSAAAKQAAGEELTRAEKIVLRAARQRAAGRGQKPKPGKPKGNKPPKPRNQALDKADNVATIEGPQIEDVPSDPETLPTSGTEDRKLPVLDPDADVGALLRSVGREEVQTVTYEYPVLPAAMLLAAAAVVLARS